MLALAYTGTLAGAPLAARLVPWFGRRPTAFAGIVLVGLGLLPLGLTGAAAAVPMVAFLLVLEGVGQGLLNVAYTDLVTGTLPERDRGVAGSLALLTRTVGIVSGASILTALHAHGAAGGDFRRLPLRLSWRRRRIVDRASTLLLLVACLVRPLPKPVAGHLAGARCGSTPFSANYWRQQPRNRGPT
jgi:MFS family permease